MLKFQSSKNQSSIIKVIGVGGGGSNAVNHMYKQGIKGVDFIICNTDAQAMETSEVPIKIQLGANLTGGLGAGAAPSVGRNAALENAEDIRNVLGKETKMLFITAGLGGGTGTGAAPVIAQISRELNILTVGIVTIPFSFEGRKRHLSAVDGISQLKKNVDALLIISNDKLRDLCGDLPLSQAFSKADNVLTTAAKGIAEIITVTGYINVDFEDVKTVMHNSGRAIMGTGVAGGPDRAEAAVEAALNSPLLDDTDITGTSNMLLYISSGKKEVTMDEVTIITEYIQRQTHAPSDVIWGNGYDETLEDEISVTIVATGFDKENLPREPEKPQPKKVVGLYPGETPDFEYQPPVPEPEQKSEPVMPYKMKYINLDETVAAETEPAAFYVTEPETSNPVRTLEFAHEPTEPEVQPEPAATLVDEVRPEIKEEITEPRIILKASTPAGTPRPAETAPDDFQERKATERVSKLRQLSERLKTHQPIEQNLYELENVPAYKRRNVELADITPSSESEVADYSVGKQTDKGVEIGENKFLFKKVD